MPGLKELKDGLLRKEYEADNQGHEDGSCGEVPEGPWEELFN